jgi:hypothetical protein
VTDENDGVRFERADINPRGLVWFLFLLVFAALLVAFLIREMYWGLAAHEARMQPPPPIMSMEVNRQPPAPRLEENPAASLAAFRAEEAKTLEGYGWVDKGAGVVRIPVSRAMALLLERGLPEASPPPPGEERPK